MTLFYKWNATMLNRIYKNPVVFMSAGDKETTNDHNTIRNFYSKLYKRLLLFFQSQFDNKFSRFFLTLVTVIVNSVNDTIRYAMFHKKIVLFLIYMLKQPNSGVV